MKTRSNIICVISLTIFIAILEIVLYKMQGYNLMLAIAIIYGFGVVSLLELNIYDFIFILLPIMFYINIGGAVNTSAADFLIAYWLFGMLFKQRGVLGFDIQSDALYQTHTYIIRFALIFVLVMIASMINFFRWENALVFSGILSIFKIIICFIYASFTVFYLDKYGRNRFLRIMAYSTIGFDILMIVGVIAYTMGIDLGLTFSGTFRATGTFEDPNLAAAYLFIMFSFAAIYFEENRYIIRLLLTIVLTFISIFLTSSKGALVAMLFGIAMIGILNILRGNFPFVFRSVCIVGLIFLLLFYLYNHFEFVRQICMPVFSRLQEFTGNIDEDLSLQHREFLWKTAFDLGMSEPILGIGVEQFRPAATQVTGENVWNIVHNTYLTFFCELGIIGVWAFFRLWIKNFINHLMLIKYSRSSPYILFSILCVSISMWSISLGNFRSLWIFMTFVLYEYNRYIFKNEKIA